MKPTYEVEGMKVTEEAYQLFEQACNLQALDIPLVAATVAWEGDDSPDSYDTLKNMIDLAKHIGGYVARVTVNGLIAVTGEKDLSSGKYVFYLE